MCPVAADGLSGSRKPGPEAAGAGGRAVRGSTGRGGRGLPPGRMLRCLPPEENLQGGWTKLPGARRDTWDDAHGRGGGCGPRAAGGRQGAGGQVQTSPLDRAAQTTAPVFIHKTTQRIRLGYRQKLHSTFI